MSGGKITTIEEVMSKCDNADKPSDRSFGHTVRSVLDKKKILGKTSRRMEAWIFTINSVTEFPLCLQNAGVFKALCKRFVLIVYRPRLNFI